MGRTITLLRAGGTLRPAKGKVVSHTVRDDPTPKLHQRCLVFLKAEPELDAFTYTKFWLIEDNLMVPVFADDRSLGLNSTVAAKPLSEVIKRLGQQP